MSPDYSSTYQRFAREHGLDEAPEDAADTLALRSTGWRVAAAVEGELPGGERGTVARCWLGRERPGGEPELLERTVALTRVPEAARYAEWILCVQPGLSGPAPPGGAPRGGGRLWTESIAANERFEITVAPGQDENWLRRLFSPSFIDYLAGLPLWGFGFELERGALACSVEEADLGVEQLESFCEAASAVTARIREEATE